jgi:putative Mg2+ transporter-C (MgtC) family protein
MLCAMMTPGDMPISTATADHLALVGKLALAVVLGGAVGLEREWNGKYAGLRTHALICLGSALVMELSRTLSDPAGHSGDPARLAAQVVSGVGFLGAGTIMQRGGGGGVTGLTTAATLWVVACLGLAVGAGFYVEAIATATFVAGVLIGLGYLEGRLFHQRHPVGSAARRPLGSDEAQPPV